mmetsp:Transcript_39578/g.123270  ORF Transcript_39578/g.123270 Transcript_39578/m.123270 type:complete len:211 (+) Transcript_39578:1086-1718(+)
MDPRTPTRSGCWPSRRCSAPRPSGARRARRRSAPRWSPRRTPPAPPGPRSPRSPAALARRGAASRHSRGRRARSCCSPRTDPPPSRGRPPGESGRGRSPPRPREGPLPTTASTGCRRAHCALQPTRGRPPPWPTPSPCPQTARRPRTRHPSGRREWAATLRHMSPPSSAPRQRSRRCPLGSNCRTSRHPPTPGRPTAGWARAEGVRWQMP